MASQRRLNRNFSGLEITDLPHHDDIGVLSENGSQAPGEGHVHLGIDLGLPHTRQHVFDRVFDRQNIARALVDAGQPCIKRRGLARARRTGHQNDSVGAGQGASIRRVDLLIHLQLTEIQLPGLLIKQSQHHPLTVGRRNGRHTNINAVARYADRDAAILRHALLGNIQLRHHFQSGHQQRRERSLGREYLAQHPIHPVADAKTLLEGFDVDVRGLLFDRLRKNGVNQTNNRRIVVGIHQVADIGQLLHQSRQINIRGQVLGHLRRLVLGTLIGHSEPLTELILLERRQ